MSHPAPANPCPQRHFQIDTAVAANYHFALMSAALPEMLDAWRMVAARRCFEGRLPLSAFERLRGSLQGAEGDCRYVLEFGRDDVTGIRYLDLQAEAGLSLQCQRTLETFVLPVRIDQRMGLITDESQEAGLPPGVEPVLLDADGTIRPAELIEDELILAVPLVPVKPGTEAVEQDWPADTEADEPAPNPFAALAALKDRKK